MTYINWSPADLISIDGIGVTMPNYTFDGPVLPKNVASREFLNWSDNELDASDDLSQKYANAMKAVDGE